MTAEERDQNEYVHRARICATQNPELYFDVREETLSCTGPVIMEVRINRDLVRTLEISEDTLIIELAEVVT